MTGLAALARRSHKTTIGTTGLASLARRGNKSEGGSVSLTSLASLARRGNPRNESAETTTSEPRKSALASLASKRKKVEEKPKVEEKSVPQDTELSNASPTPQEATPIQQIAQVTTPPAPSPKVINDKTNSPTSSTPPPNLIAPPSLFASFIFRPCTSSIDANIFFSNTVKPTSAFKFDEPSPDDVVLAAQKGSNKQKAANVKPSRQSAATTKSNNASSDLAAMGLRTKSDQGSDSSQLVTPPTSAPTSRPVTPKPLKNRIDVVEEYQKRDGGKPGMNLVVIGHVDAGKSTLMGHLLVLLGAVSEKTYQKYERDSKKIGKGSFAFAWVLDETEEERSRGVTIDVAMNKFETEHRRFTVLDAPGHRDFIPNMISGASQADVAILVVDATTGEFESGFQGNGQTKEHALLVRSLGVQQMVIAINKLDAMDWSKERYHEIEGLITPFLLQAGFRKNNLTFIPCSGLTGDNLLKKPDTAALSWYTGPSIIEQIDTFEPPLRQVEQPLRMSVSDLFKGGVGSTTGVTVAGRVESGSVQIGETIMAVPGNEIGIVKAIEVGDDSAKWAVAGDTVLLTLTGIDILQLHTGSIICTPDHPISTAAAFLCQVILFEIKVPITTGYPIILHHQSINEPAYIRRLVATMDKSTGEVTKKNPRALTRGQTATIEVAMNQRSLPLETFKVNKELGRVMLRKGGETIGAGIILELL